MTPDLSGHNAVVTGAAAGIGLSVAKKLSAEGANVALLDRDAKTLSGSAADITALSGSCRSWAVDVADGQRMSEVAREIVVSFGPVSIVVNCAGDKTGARLDALTEDGFVRSLRGNVWGIIATVQAFLPSLRESGRGSIINVASIAGHVGMAGMAAYCAGKGAVISLTRAMAIELAPDRIRANSISPATVLTPSAVTGLRRRGMGDLDEGVRRTGQYYPLQRICAADEVAEAAWFLASGSSSFITGEDLKIDGGLLTCTPYERRGNVENVTEGNG